MTLFLCDRYDSLYSLLTTFLMILIFVFFAFVFPDFICSAKTKLEKTTIQLFIGLIIISFIVALYPSKQFICGV